jgi:serine/threonine-protein kinase HipA
MVRELATWAGGRRVGTLREQDDLWSFEYEPAWAVDPTSFDLSPALPRSSLQHADGASRRSVQWYFDNLLPEEALRQSIERDAGIRGDDAFALLEYLGAESAGSLTLLPPGTPLPTAPELRTLPLSALSERIARLPRTPLTHDAPKRMSLAGAQHKSLVVWRNGELLEPVGAAASTHILKPEHPSLDYPASVANEFLTMQLARALGLQVPALEWLHVPQPVYMVERFDRAVDADGKVQRLHVIDACQLLDKSRLFKHSHAGLATLNDIVARCASKTATQVRLYRWLLFNVLVGNDDCHLKNLSFRVDARRIELAPHYDLLATSAWNTRAFADQAATWPEGRLAIPLPGANRFDEVRRASLLEAGRVLGLAAHTAERMLRQLLQRMPHALERLCAQMQNTLDALDGEARNGVAVQTRLLRVMRLMVVREMLTRVA